MRCCNPTETLKNENIGVEGEAKERLKKIVLVGTPNVGKSVLFNRLTRSYVTVSNYPGTTVEVSRGKGIIGSKEYEIVDTPGMYSFMCITEEEKVTKRLLFNEKPEIVLHVIDTKNLERMLPLTFQLIESGFPVILVLNMVDEAKKLGLRINVEKLEEQLGIPVVPTTAALNKGVDILRERIDKYVNADSMQLRNIYDDKIEEAIQNIENILKGDYVISKRALSLLLLQEDEDALEEAKELEGKNYLKIINIIEETKKEYEKPLTFVISFYRQKRAKILTDNVMTKTKGKEKNFSETLNRIMINPITGIPIALLVLYFGLYKFVGQFGAGVVVDFLEGGIFEAHINPWINNILNNHIPWEWLRALIGGDYGIITLGIRYAVAIVLPIVGTFFFVFSIIEDSGYLPRLAMLVDRLFKNIGLNGRAVIPMVLGFGCDTMATMVSRTLETERERIISTLLLALAIPCSAQLGVILSLLSGDPKALIVWIIFIGFIFLFIGYLAAKVLPGEEPLFYMEMPPLRLPKLSNVLVKTYTRMEWYFAEILPLFILISILIWFGNIIGIFPKLVGIFRPFVVAIGLPNEVSEVFLFGFFRRDYGAAGLFDLVKEGILSTRQLVVAAVTLTLFVPCVAQFVMMIKERGFKTAIYIAAFVFVFSFFAGYVLNWILLTTGVLA